MALNMSKVKFPFILLAAMIAKTTANQTLDLKLDIQETRTISDFSCLRNKSMATEMQSTSPGHNSAASGTDFLLPLFFMYFVFQ